MERIERLERQLESRKLVERAKWVLVGERGMSEPDAHFHLQKLARFDFVGRPVATIERALARVNWYELRPRRLYVVDNAQGFGHRDEIFSHGGGKRLAQEVGTAFLGEIPIDTRIRFGGDAGVPIVIASPDSAVSQGFMQLASTVALKMAATVLGKPKKSPRLAVIK